MFDDLLAANRRYASKFHDSGVPGSAAKGLAVLTCIDSRIDPLAMLGLIPGDAKIIRNAGARVTDDALRSLVLAVNLLNVSRICVVQHTDCAMSKSTDDEIRSKIGAGDDFAPLAMTDQTTALKEDIDKIRASKYVPSSTEIGGFLYDVRTGELLPAEI
ncbi:MAG TPA: carbonic anhydrase [Acidimicrobiales bacterium]|nr:carbonic anhydrase [Acidimicrobiales bacterium]